MSFRCSRNWINEKFGTIKLEDFRAMSLMDENWLVLYKDDEIYLWDCHTQKIHWICEIVVGFFTSEPVAILGGAYNGKCPPILVRKIAKYVNSEFLYGIAANGEFFVLDQIKHSDKYDKNPQQITEDMILLPSKSPLMKFQFCR